MQTADVMNINTEKGFTLVEMTVSMLLLSFITIIGYQGIMFGIKQWQQGSDKMSHQYDSYHALSWLRNKLGASEIVKDANGDDNVYLFKGRDDSVEFVARYTRTRKGGLFVNRVSLDEEDGNIYVSYYLHHPEINPVAGAGSSQRVVLLSDVRSMRFLYYGERGGNSAKWYSHWEASTRLPWLVRLDIKSESGESYEATIQVKTSSS